MSNLYARASIGIVEGQSNAATSWLTASLSGIVLTIGHNGISGSPSKYIWVISRCAKPWPNTEKWTCEGLQSLIPFGQG